MYIYNSLICVINTRLMYLPVVDMLCIVWRRPPIDVIRWSLLTIVDDTNPLVKYYTIVCTSWFQIHIRPRETRAPRRTRAIRDTSNQGWMIFVRWGVYIYTSEPNLQPWWKL
jgi:hypothetical protein